MDNAIFTEDMTPDEFMCRTCEVAIVWPQEARDKVVTSFMNVLAAKINSGEWNIYDVEHPFDE